MPQVLLSSLFGSSSLKITNSDTGQKVLLPIRTIRVKMEFPSKVARHQMEDGSTKIDQRILNPVVITIELIAPTADVVGQVNAITADRKSRYTISSRGMIVEDMRVEEQNIDQSAENTSSMPIQLVFTQLMFQGKITAVYVQAADASLIDRGAAFLSEAKQTISDVASKVESALAEVL